MYHAVQHPEAGIGVRQCSPHFFFICYVGRCDEHFRAELFQQLHAEDPLTSRIGLVVLGKPRFPDIFRRKVETGVKTNLALADLARYSATSNPTPPRPPVIK